MPADEGPKRRGFLNHLKRSWSRNKPSSSSSSSSAAVNGSEPQPTHRLAPPANEDGSEPSCRVCYGHHGPLLPNHLIDPCDCRGDMRYIHRRCLYNWMESRPGIGPTKNLCEICKATIDSKTLLGPLRGDQCDEDAPVQINFFPFVKLTM